MFKRTLSLHSVALFIVGMMVALPDVADTVKVVDTASMHEQNLATLKRLLREGKVVEVATDMFPENKDANAFCHEQVHALQQNASTIGIVVPAKVYSGPNARKLLEDYIVDPNQVDGNLGARCQKRYPAPKTPHPGHELEYYEVYTLGNSSQHNPLIFEQSKGQYGDHPYEAGWFSYVASRQRCSAPEGYGYPDKSDSDLKALGYTPDWQVPVADVYAYKDDPVFYRTDQDWDDKVAVPGRYAIYLFLPQRWGAADSWQADSGVAKVHGNASLYSCRIEVEFSK